MSLNIRNIILYKEIGVKELNADVINFNQKFIVAVSGHAQ